MRPQKSFRSSIPAIQIDNMFHTPYTSQSEPQSLVCIVIVKSTLVNSFMKENVNEIKNDNEKPGRLGRILSLVELLRERPELTHTELAKHLRITVRQLYIDRNALLEAGFIFTWDRKLRKHVIEQDPFKKTVSIDY